MKTSLSIIAAILALFIGTPLVRAMPGPVGPAPGQSPASLAGDTLMIEILQTNFTYTYSFLVVDDTGSNFSNLPISTSDFNSGTVSYTNTTSSNGVLTIDSLSQDKNEQLSLLFFADGGGIFLYTNLTDANSGSGAFELMAATAPASFAGKCLFCSVVNGAAPFAAQGTFQVYYSATGTSYMIVGSGGVLDSAGNCSFAPLNTSTVSVPVNDSVTGSATAFLGFQSSSNGLLAIAQTNTGGYQVDAFLLTSTLPPFFFNSTPLGDSWYVLSAGPNNLYGTFNYGYLPYIYHSDLGWEYYVDPGSDSNGAYFYDFHDNAWYYTDPFTFPYLYDFNADSWMWYEPDPNNPGHYTTAPRWFYDFNTTNWVNSL